MCIYNYSKNLNKSIINSLQIYNGFIFPISFPTHTTFLLNSSSPNTSFLLMCFSNKYGCADLIQLFQSQSCSFKPFNCTFIQSKPYLSHDPEEVWVSVGTKSWGSWAGVGGGTIERMSSGSLSPLSPPSRCELLQNWSREEGEKSTSTSSCDWANCHPTE